MTRVKISLFILSALITFSIFSGVWVNKSCENMLEIIEDVRRFSYENMPESALETAGRFEESWESFRHMANVMVKSDKLSEIDRITSRIIPLLENGSDEIDAELDELSKMIYLLQSGEKPSFTSIF